MPHRSSNEHDGGLQKPTAKRSPSILVTDSRSNKTKVQRAPFAGQNFRKRLQQNQGHNGNTLHNPTSYNIPGYKSNRYNEISIDKLLSNSSDIPSGQSRLPSFLSREGARRNAGSPILNGSSLIDQPSITPEISNKGAVRSIPTLSSSLPSRSSKKSQRLVLIPDQHRLGSSSPPHHVPASVPFAEMQNNIIRSRAELMPKEIRAQEFSRMTAYYICEVFNLKAILDFLKKYHRVKPRIYDEALYVPYSLPLLPGTDGYRVKSNDSVKLQENKKYMERLINKTEQKNHLYEYYSGVETPEDANNYSMDPEENDNTSFDPSEPQFFAPELNVSESPKEYRGTLKESVEVSKPSESAIEPQKEEFVANSKTYNSTDSQLEVAKHYGEMFIFNYGIIVFWNFSETHEKNILADLAFALDVATPLMIKPIDQNDIETEEFHFEYDSNIQRPRIYNDMITLRSGDHLIKLTMSHAIAQSTKLCLFESRMLHSLQSISKLPKKLALTGKLGLNRQQLLKKSGKLFKLRVDVNLSSSILDTPDFFWSSEPALNPLYSGVREYLEIDQRVQVLNDRCKVFLEFSDIVSDSMNEKNTNRVTKMIMIIILINLAVSMFEFFLEFF